ncbi:glycosyltransferase family 39 protein [Candidatus Palauibacter sp.]|uniref:glycosyltransferase family 39 protein n=1 Tax=Candidatus Palauibacter sp. TaxID=3101350 RepID=UPI003B010F64
MTRVTEAGDLAKRVAGWLFLVVPFMPLRLLFDDPPGSSGLPGPGEWMLGLLVCAGVAWLASRRFPLAVERSADALAGVLRFPPFPAFLLAVLAALAALLTATSLAAFSRRPLLVDTIAQLFQAKIFAGGVAWVPAPELGAFFATQHMVSDAGRWYAQYPPGHPAALAIGVWAGAPWLVPILFSLLSAWLVIDTARHIFGEAVGRVTAVLLVLAPFFWFMGASHMNHVSSHLHISLFLWCFARWAGTGPRPRVGDAAPRGWILAAGLALGAAFVTRPLTALAVGGALALPALRLAAPCRWSTALLGAGGFLGVASLYPIFNAATTGDPLTPGYLRLWGESHGLGFHLSPWGELHTPLAGLRNELIDLGLLQAFLFEGPIPALAPLGIFLAAGWSSVARSGTCSGAGVRANPSIARWDGRLLGAFLAIPAAHFFYWHRDAFLGPRFLYEGLPFLLPLLARSLLELLRHLSGRRPAWLGSVDLGTLTTALIGAAFLYSLAFGIPQRFRTYATNLGSLKRDLTAEARQAGIERGLIFVKVSWGNRLIARARGAGASASIAERAYRRSDHCELELVLREAETEGWNGARLDRTLVSLFRSADELAGFRLNGDPTLRFAPERPLAEVCVHELLYDRDGRDVMPATPSYTNYSPHLPANAPDLEGPLIFARDLRDQNRRLRARYPDLPAYLYRDGTFVRLP